MNKRELIKLLKANGWEFAHGANHDLATHPGKPGTKSPSRATQNQTSTR